MTLSLKRTFNIVSSNFLRPFTSRVRTGEDKVVITDDGSTVVSWHPEEKCPYEMSLPFPGVKVEEESLFKVQALKNLSAIKKATKPEIMRENLCTITGTYHLQWYRRFRHLRKKKAIPMERPYL